MRTLVLVDGEHYPPVTRWAIETAHERGHEVVGALFVGGMEKIDARAMPDLGVPLRVAGADRAAALIEAIDAFTPDCVLDLSDEPVLGYRERMQLAAVTLMRGLPYLGADFRLDPPVSGPPLPVPTLAVIGTGKRTGKTAISGELARLAARRGLEPVMVAMGRGGPAESRGGGGREREPGPARGAVPRRRARRQRLSGGCVDDGRDHHRGPPRRGGLAGAPYVTNVREAAEMAVARHPGVVILEGSGSAVPSGPLGRGRAGRPGRRADGIPERISRSLSAVDVRPRGCYHGYRPNWVREPLRTASPSPAIPR